MQGVYGVFAHATHFVVLLAMAGALLLTRAIDAGPVPERSGWLALLGSGALFGAAFVMKQHGIFFVLFGAAWLAWELARGGAPPARIAARCGTLLLGAALPFLLTCGLLAWAGVFKNFWFWTFDYARAYVSEVPLSLGVQIFREAVLMVAAPVFPLWVLAAVGLTAPLWDDRARARWPFIAAFTVSSFLALCPGLYFRPHYFVLILPAFALLAGIAVSAAGRAADRWSRAELVLVLVYAAALLYPVYQERSFFFRMTPRQASRMTYGVNPFPEAPEIARRLAADTTTDDHIAILGSEPEIFFYSGRRSASGYISICTGSWRASRTRTTCSRRPSRRSRHPPRSTWSSSTFPGPGWDGLSPTLRS